MNIKILLLLFGLITFCGSSQETKSTYTAAFKTIQLIDSSRVYKPDTPKTDRLHYRPLDLDIWYPSEEKKGKQMLFEDLYQLHEERANNYQDETDYTGISDELILYLAAGFGVEPKEGKRLLKVKTESFKDSPTANGKFPLVIYMAGYNGMGWESYRLLERLAQNGFVVLSISSVGRYPGDMTNDLLDTMEQVEDGEFALRELRKQTNLNIDFDKIGILGLSWGGMSGILMLDKHPEFGAMVSLDGSDIFYYGDTDEDDAFLSEIYEANLIHPEKTTASYLHIEAGDRLDEFTPTDEYHYYKKISSDKYYLRLRDSKHEDFGSIAWALRTSPEQIESYERIMESTILFFREKLNGNNGFQRYYEQLVKEGNITKFPYEYSTEKPKEILLSGKIQDSKTKEKLPYVNIGVLNKDWGTVSNKKGVFDLELNETFINDTLRISIVGYKPQTVLVKTLMNRKAGYNINLEEEISELNEVVITAKKWKYKTIGNKTKSKFLGSGFAYDMLGAEMGIRINIRKKPTFVNAFNFHISYNRLGAKAIFRLNMYKIKGGKPTDNILKESILIPVESKQTGIFTIDLKKYDIVLTDDVIVMLEWVEAEEGIKTGQGLSFSLGMFTGGTYHRKSSQGKIKKFRGFGMGYNLDVKY